MDLAFWSEATRFGAALVARQRFLPGTIHHGDGAMRAVWTPLFIGADAERLARLSQRMPAVGSGAVGPRRRPADRPAGGHCTQDLRRRGRGQPGQKCQRRSGGGSAPKGRRKEAGFRQRARRVVERPEIRSMERFTPLRSNWGNCGRRWRSGSGPLPSRPARRFGCASGLRNRRSPPAMNPTLPQRNRMGGICATCCNPTRTPACCCPPARSGKPAGQRVRELERDGFNPREFLLASLGQASGVCAGVADSLQGKRPAGRKLDADMAYRFLTRESMALEEAGYGIILPAWWSRRGARSKPTVRANVKTPQMQGGGGVSLATMPWSWTLRWRWETRS